MCNMLSAMKSSARVVLWLQLTQTHMHSMTLKRSSFRTLAILKINSLTAIKQLVSLISRLLACSARIAVTNRQRVLTLAAHARQGLIRKS